MTPIDFVRHTVFYHFRTLAVFDIINSFTGPRLVFDLDTLRSEVYLGSQ